MKNVLGLNDNNGTRTNGSTTNASPDNKVIVEDHKAEMEAGLIKEILP